MKPFFLMASKVAPALAALAAKSREASSRVLDPFMRGFLRHKDG